MTDKPGKRLEAAAGLIDLGFDIFYPLAPHRAPYDFIAARGGQLYRVRVVAGHIAGSAWHSKSHGDYDVLARFDPEGLQFYFDDLPVDLKEA